MENGNGNGNGHKHRGNTAGLKPPWPKGVSGNPGGRPKGRTLLGAITEMLNNNGGKPRTAAAKAFVAMLKRGSFNHAKELIEREEGKVPEDGEVRVVIVYADEGIPANAETSSRRAAACN